LEHSPRRYDKRRERQGHLSGRRLVGTWHCKLPSCGEAADRVAQRQRWHKVLDPPIVTHWLQPCFLPRASPLTERSPCS